MRALKLTPTLVGLMCALPISVWWFAQLTLVSPLPGPALAPLSREVLTVLVSVQLLVMCLFAPLWVLNDARLCNGRSGALLAAATIASMLLPTWPLIVMLGLASGASFSGLLITQIVIASAGLVIVAIASVSRAAFDTTESIRLILTGLGAVAAFAAWSLRAFWLQWLST
jgi:hypothetical protein